MVTKPCRVQHHNEEVIHGDINLVGYMVHFSWRHKSSGTVCPLLLSGVASSIYTHLARGRLSTCTHQIVLFRA